jgi:hypothetical protein
MCRCGGDGWLLVRRPRCEMCGTPYPCWSRRQAYRSLAAGPAVSHLTAAEVAVYPPDDLIADAYGRSRLVRSFIPPGYVDRGGNELWWTGR